MDEHRSPNPRDGVGHSPSTARGPSHPGPPGGVVRRRPPRGVRIVGYLFGAAALALIWAATNVWPGWEAVPFLSDEVPTVLGLFNLSLVAGIVANLVYVVADPRWLTAAGDLVLSVISLALSWQVAAVFPFDFTGLSYDLTTLLRILVVVGLVGAVVAVVVNLVNLGREVARVA